MHEPSNATLPSSAASSSPTGSATFLVTPWMSLNCRRMSATPASLARLTRSRLVMDILMGAHLAYCQCSAQRELAFGSLEIGFQNLRNLIQPVEDGVPMDGKSFRRFFDVFTHFEI